MKSNSSFYRLPKTYRNNFTIEEWKTKAEALWALLDDIDTAGDMFKPEITPFFKYVMGKSEERHNYLESDGYNLFAI